MRPHGNSAHPDRSAVDSRHPAGPLGDGRTAEAVLADAEAFGVDVGLLRATLALSVAQRLELLEANVAFLADFRLVEAPRPEDAEA